MRSVAARTWVDPPGSSEALRGPADDRVDSAGRPPLGGGPPTLTPRQVEILQLLADGLSPQQIARSLGLSKKTVHNHLQLSYRSLDAQSQVHAVVAAVRYGLVRI